MRRSGYRFVSLALLLSLVVGCSVDVHPRTSGGGSGGGGTTPLVITTTSPLPSGVVNTAYTETLAATGGNGTYTWSILSGTLPAGLTLNAGTGIISGTPTTAGSSSFTIQVADSESTPQTATLAAVLVINAPLTITTTSLPAGQQNIAYSAQLAASGGLPPYTWSLGTNSQLPAGLTLSAGGLISGTPTAVSDTTPEFVVTDSAKNTASANLRLVINPATASIPDGTYSFVFAGNTPQGSPSKEDSIAVNGTFKVQSGTVLSGYVDEATNSGDLLKEQAISGGTWTNGADGLGSVVFDFPGGGTVTLDTAVPASAAAGKSTAIRIVQFDDTTGSGTRGSGILKVASPSTLISDIKGNFSFLFSGVDLNSRQEALVGSFQTDGSGKITGGSADANAAGTHQSWSGVGGSYSIDSKGRGSLTITLGGGSFHFSFYEASPGEWMVISTDKASLNSPLVSGRVLQQTISLSSTPLPAKGIMELNGLHPISTGGVVPDITLGLVTADSSTGKVVYDFDEYNGTLATGTMVSANYSIDMTTGRATPTATWEPILYIIDPNSAFILVPTDTSASSGIIEAQSGSPYANASFTGNYLGGSLPLAIPDVLNEIGLVAADGQGNITMTTNRSTNKGLVQYQTITGTYAADSNGRIVVTTPDSLVRIFYVISPTKVSYLTNDGGGYLGIFEQ